MSLGCGDQLVAGLAGTALRVLKALAHRVGGVVGFVGALLGRRGEFLGGGAAGLGGDRALLVGDPRGRDLGLRGCRVADGPGLLDQPADGRVELLGLGAHLAGQLSAGDPREREGLLCLGAAGRIGRVPAASRASRFRSWYAVIALWSGLSQNAGGRPGRPSARSAWFSHPG